MIGVPSRKGDISIGFIVLILVIGAIAYQCTRRVGNEEVAQLLGGSTTKGDVAGKIVGTTIDAAGLSARRDETGQTAARGTIREGLETVKKINDTVAAPAGQATFEAIARESVDLLRSYGLAKSPDGRLVKSGQADGGVPLSPTETSVVAVLPSAPRVTVVGGQSSSVPTGEVLPNLFQRQSQTDPAVDLRRGAAILYRAYSNPDYDDSMAMLTEEQAEYCIRFYVKDGRIVDHESVIQVYCDGF